MATTFKLITKNGNGKSITKDVDEWALNQFRAANKFADQLEIELSEDTFTDKKPVYFHIDNYLIKVTMRAKKGPAKGSLISKKEADSIVKRSAVIAHEAGYEEGKESKDRDEVKEE